MDVGGSGRPLQKVHLHVGEWALYIDPLANCRNGAPACHEQHGRVHMWRFEQVQPTLLVVERASSIVEGRHAMGTTRADENDLARTIGWGQPITSSLTSFEVVRTKYVGSEMHHRLVSVPQFGAEPHLENSVCV